MSTLKQTIKQITKNFEAFTARGAGIFLFFYQLAPALAIAKSIINKLGLDIVVIISRQAGKDETIVNLISWLLLIFAHREVEIVVANPTYKPQTEKMMLRLESRLDANILTKALWRKRTGFMRLIGKAICNFLSADGKANVVGATASLGLFINEAQDIEIVVYDKRFAPMVASTNATRVFFGTVWTKNTLLARERRNAEELQKQDGIRRVFIYTSDDVRKVNKAYGIFVDGQVKKLGRQHPLVKTQYFCEEIDAITGMFNAGRMALIQAPTLENTQPEPGKVYCLLMDVGGQDEAMLELDGMSNPGRDYVTIDIIEVDLSTLTELQAPTYHIVKRLDFHGQNHVNIFGAIVALVQTWNILYIVLDATGVGEGLWGMCAKKYPSKTIPIKFTQQVKSELGYGYLAVVDTGRLRDHCHTETVAEQYANCTSEILIGPAKTMRWGVKDGTRGADGNLVHDDYITTDALTAELDKLEWFIPSETSIIEPEEDLLESMGRNY